MPQTTLLYSSDSMKQALQEVRNGVPVRTAAKIFGVPKTTLLYKSRGIIPEECKKGPATNLSSKEEEALVQWLFYISDKGFPATKNQLLDSVELIVKTTKRPNSFTNNRPGRKWYNCFMKRHPIILERISQNLTASRASVTEEKIRSWFLEITKYIKTEGLGNIWEDPRRVFNADETAFFLSPKGEKVLTRTGNKTVYSHINNDEKENLTTLINVNAAGMIVPPLVVFKYERIPPHIANLMPPNFGIAKSESGWMTGPTFFEYVTNIFYPWLVNNNIPFPIVLFVDGHKSHLTMSLSNFRSEKKIILIALYPNATHLLQPLDVAVFRSLKSGWKEEVKKWKIENDGAKFKREYFGSVLKTTIEKHITSNAVTNGFKCTGLFPLNPEAINFNKYFKGQEINTKINRTDRNEEELKSKREYLNYLESNIPSETLDTFKNCHSNIWNGRLEDKSLFQVWWKTVQNLEVLPLETFDDQTLNEPPTAQSPDLSQNRKLIENSKKFNESNQMSPKMTDISSPKPSCSNSSNVPFNVPSPSDEDFNTELSQSKKSNENNRDTIENNTTSQTIADISSPMHSSNPSKVPFNVPSPFKKCLFWPEPEKSIKPKRSKEKIPYVASSQEWKAYHSRKQQLKDEKEKEKEERKRKREERKIISTQTITVKKAKKKVFEDSSSDSSVEINLESEDEGDDWILEKNEDKENDNNSKEFTVGNHIIIKYENNYYPGKVTEKKQSKALVSVMTASTLNNWKWPIPKDEIWYDEEEIVQVISDPVPLNKRGVFKVPELEKYSAYYIP